MTDDLARARALVDRELRQSSAGRGALGGEIVAALAAAGLLGSSDTEHDHGSLVHVLTHTPIGIPGRTLDGTEANDVADLVFGPTPGRVGSPASDDEDDEDVPALWVRVTLADTGARIATKPMVVLPVGTDDEATGEVWVSSADVRPLLLGLPSPTSRQTGIDTCRHHPSTGVDPRYEIQGSGYAPEEPW